MINFQGISISNTDKISQLLGVSDRTIVGEPFKISWNAATTTTGSIVRYEVLMRNTDSNDASYSTTVDSSTLSVSLTPFVSGVYVFYVKAVDSNGDTKTINTDPQSNKYVVMYYNPPTCSYNVTRSGNQLKVSLSISYSSLMIGTTKHNEVKLSSISYAYSQGADSAPSNWTALSSSSYGITTSTRASGNGDGKYILSINTADNDSFCRVNLADSDYEFALRFHDDVYPGDEFRITTSIPGLSPIFGEFDDGHVVVGMYPEFGDDALLQVGGEILAYDNSTAHHVASELAALQNATSGLSTMQSDINNLKSEVGVGVAVSTPTRIDNLEDLISSLYYKPGDSVTFTDIYLAGFVTNAGKDICWSIVPPKPLASTVRGFTLSNVQARVRANGAYIHGSGTAMATMATSSLTTASLANTGGILNIKYSGTGTTGAQYACGIHLTCTVTFT